MSFPLELGRGGGLVFAAGLVALSSVLLCTSLSLAQVKAQDGQVESLSRRSHRWGLLGSDSEIKRSEGLYGDRLPLKQSAGELRLPVRWRCFEE